MEQIKKISIIIPFHDEKENIPILIDSLLSECKKLNPEFEIVLVDDGSLDDYFPGIEGRIDGTSIKLVKLNRQMGKGRALTEGIEKSVGDAIVFMDADLQDDPADIQKLITKLGSGLDFVNGIRVNRKDNLIIKIYSALAGGFLRTYLHSPFTDINCGFKIFRRKILKTIVLYGNNFRFLPLAAFYDGYKVGEVGVTNNPRIHGKSKFGMSKLFIGIVDTLSAYFLYKFAEKPLHFFGKIGAWLLTIGGIALVWVTYERIFLGVLLYRRPALQYAIFLMILGIQIVMTGVIGELIVYLHHKKNT